MPPRQHITAAADTALQDSQGACSDAEHNVGDVSERQQLHVQVPSKLSPLRICSGLNFRCSPVENQYLNGGLCTAALQQGDEECLAPQSHSIVLLEGFGDLLSDFLSWLQCVMRLSAPESVIDQ